MLFKRTVCVDRVQVDSVSFSSVFQIGDSNQIKASSRAIAVQREAEIFFGNEGSFAAYPIFSESIPFSQVDEVFSCSFTNVNPVLKVSNIKIMGASSSSVIHLGNSCHIATEARVKHIRQLLPRENSLNGKE